MENNNFGIDPTGAPRNISRSIILDGEELTHIRSKYRDSINDEDWDVVLHTAFELLGRCPDPKSQVGRVTGLALGKVQSGKTLSYSTLIALAFDNDYRVTIVLAGTKVPLLEQTNARIEDDLVGGRRSITLFSNPNINDSEVIQSVLYSNGHVIITVLKKRQRIDDITALFSEPSLGTRAVLVIDDEGDEASLNTQFRKRGQSATYRSILGLRSVLRNHAYIAYTATPQANLLIHGIDGLSPDFGTLVYPGNGYCGGRVFFGEHRENYVREVSEEDAQQSSGSIPESLRLAVSIFLVGAAFRHQRDASARHSMLIHNSSRKDEHAAANDSMRQLINQWRTTISLPDTDPARQDLLTIFHNAYFDLSRTVSNPPTWDVVSNALRNEIWQVEVWMVNSRPDARDPMSMPFRLNNNIFVGGNMLGRGLTIHGLAVTYITRRARTETNADTLEQRSRWFGYKQEYLDLCRIFLTRQLEVNYSELLRHEDDFWDALERNMRQGIPMKDWPRMFLLDKDMGINPTRHNVADYRRFRGNDWDTQRVLIKDGSISASNISMVNQFIQKHPGTRKPYGSTEHTIIEKCPTDKLILDLLDRVNTTGTNWDNAYTKEYLTRLLLGGRLPCLDVLIMSNGDPRERTEVEGRVNPMQGRNPNYLGDEHIHNGRVQFQIHIIRLLNTDSTVIVDKTTAFALYVPMDDPNYDLKYVVRDKENEPN